MVTLCVTGQTASLGDVIAASYRHHELATLIGFECEIIVYDVSAYTANC